ncbi:hypothetical protein [Bradyrhizobium lablabi]|uniref:hypothetical protein n=1 Tax=Bradyrhizobium lablabi TaxID=722472 RepID=UPI001BA4CDF9|nr:hypothetical protein [Bradyrhizobium lablabi]MBR0695169.1 hypothetical protein [Bradyrhizobium lablabi]
MSANDQAFYLIAVIVCLCICLIRALSEIETWREHRRRSREQVRDAMQSVAPVAGRRK